MNTQNQNTYNITLSDAEKEMIRIKREKDALAKQEALAKKKIEDENKVKKALAEKETILKEAEEQRNSFLPLFNALNTLYPNLYKLVEFTSSKRVEAYNYYSKHDENRPEGLDDNREFLFNEIVEYELSKIVRISDEKYGIYLSLHDVPVSRYTRRKEYRMFVYGPKLSSTEERRALKSVETAHRKIQETLDSIVAQANQDNIQKRGWDKLLNDCKTEYPEAEVEQTTKWNSGGRHSNGYESKHVMVKFKNGLEIMYSFHAYMDNNVFKFTKSLYSVNWTGLDSSEMIKALKEVSPKKKEA